MWRSARVELAEARACQATAEAENVEAYAKYEAALDAARAAIAAEEAAVDRLVLATEAYTSALSGANELGLAAQLLLEHERLHFVDGDT